jgi:hypothetical protein
MERFIFWLVAIKQEKGVNKEREIGYERDIKRAVALKFIGIDAETVCKKGSHNGILSDSVVEVRGVHVSANGARNEKGTPFPRCPRHQNSRERTATIEASFGCKKHPRPRR